MNRFYTPEQLSEHLAETPEGFLVCKDVPVARLGEQTYKGDEVPVEPGKDGLVIIKRIEEEVFKPEAVQSFEGKPFTIDHPDEMVTPENWIDLSHGFITNVRRGAREQFDLLIGDIVITTKKAIELVKSGMREISCGYDADYVQLEPGIGVQKNIMGNHIALVMKGRAGHRCAIGDKACNHCGNCHNNKIQEDEDAMKFRDKLANVYRKLMKDADFEKLPEEEKANKLADAASEAIESEGEGLEKEKPLVDQGEEEIVAPEEKEEEVVEEKETPAPGGGGEVTISQLNDTVNRLIGIIEAFVKSASSINEGLDKKTVDENVNTEGALKEENKAFEADEAVNTEGALKEENKAFEADEDPDEKEEKMKAEAKDCDSVWHDVAYRADLLMPGIRLVKPTKDHKASLSRLKVKALKAAFTSDAETVTPYVKGNVESLKEDALDIAFIAVSDAIKNKNNKFVRDSVITNTQGVTSEIRSINDKNKAFWKKDKK